MTNKTATTEVAQPENKELATRVEQETNALFAAVPTTSGDGDSFFAQVLTDDLDSLVGKLVAEKLPKAEDMVGRKLNIKDMHKNMSDIEENDWDFYLIVDATDIANGERVIFQTGSGQPSILLMRIYAERRLPSVVEFIKSDKKTKAGFYPMNLVVHSLAPKPTA